MGLQVALQPYNIMIACIGLVLGIVIGVLPGLGGANGVAILIPITFTMNPISAVILLACIYWGALYGGGICSILFNIPGEPWAVAATFDGYPMAKAGRAGKALVLSFLGHGVGEIFLTVEEGLKMEGVKAKVTFKDILEGLKELVIHAKVLVLGSLIGCWLGIQPGGATPASFKAYGFAKSSAKDKDQYGKGASSGIIAPEAAGHGAGTSATLPMITLGIPGSPTMAVIMGGLLIMGLQPGPMLFKEHPDFVWGLIGSIWVAHFLGLIIVMAFAPFFAAILRIKFSVLMPIIIYVCAIGAFAVNNRMIDIYYLLIFGVIGYLFKKLDYPIAPMVLALVLGSMAESTVRQALIMGRGNPLIFFRPSIALPLMLLAILLFVWPSISAWRKKIAAKQKTGGS